MGFEPKISLRVLLYDLEDMESKRAGIVPLCIIKDGESPTLIPFFEEVIGSSVWIS